MSYPRSAIPFPILTGMLLLAACSKPVQPPTPRSTPLADLPIDGPASPTTPNDTADPQAFEPLRSQPVKDAIHRALRTGQTQRWQDGALSGYAVPSAATDRNGCRAVRYTVDQRPGAAWQAINACDANPAN